MNNTYIHTYMYIDNCNRVIVIIHDQHDEADTFMKIHLYVSWVSNKQFWDAMAPMWHNLNGNFLRVFDL